jgi:hypothetical protein
MVVDILQKLPDLFEEYLDDLIVARGNVPTIQRHRR